MSQRINELALPKGNVIPECELCGQNATTKCESCRLTHYCSEKHKNTDWESFHQYICKKIAFIRGEHPLHFNMTERREANYVLEQSKLEILKLAEIWCRKWLLAKNPDYAYPPAMYAINVAEDVRGQNSVEVVNPLCLVAEVYLACSLDKVALDYMVQATYIAHSKKSVPPAILIHLHRLRGLYFMQNSDWSNSNEAFSELVYYLAELHGTLDIRIELAYGYLGLTQLQLKNLDGGLSCFHKMADMWLKYFLDHYGENSLREPTEIELMDAHIQEMELQFLETKQVLGWIYEAVRHEGMNTKTDLIMFKLVLMEALSWMRMKKFNIAVVFKEEALSIALRTKQDKAVPEDKAKLLMEIVGEDYIMKWEKKHNRPRTVATKYLEMVKAL